MRRIKFILLLISALLVFSVGQAKQKKVAYRVANGYFVRNDVKRVSKTVITSQQDFEANFGCAAVMGKNGMPTSIDFAKEFVIAVDKADTDYSTELSPVGLIQMTKGKLLFTYKTKKGTKQTYTIHPCLLIIVENSHKGTVGLREISGH